MEDNFTFTLACKDCGGEPVIEADTIEEASDADPVTCAACGKHLSTLGELRAGLLVQVEGAAAEVAKAVLDPYLEK